ncbi:M20/M25/M40 family metallo-hydrolase [Rhizobium sp. LjRoot254]|uniref:M20/M25/M40 family metallo-hydrolase n=1 Tax=Rhizobium sp. LjRoot254 TaxID=3342297 RepID=UPI003ED16FDE
MTDDATDVDATWQPFNRVKDISYRLVSWPSESGTSGEAEFADRLAGLLREIPYFRDHPEDIALIDSHGAPTAGNVVAVVRGSGKRTLAFGGHFDTVETSNYLELKHLACKPDELTAALIADLESRPLTATEARALDDLRSGDFVPGRGMLDMKSGVAAGIAALERFSEMADRVGNLVLFATPDEERNSRGMRSLRDALPGLMKRWNLDIVAGVNLDATSDQGDGSEGRAIYRGTIGKLLPFAFVVGQASHASYPFEGISAHRIASEIMLAFEANPALCDTGEAQVSPPPICLEAKDLRGGYEVTTPDKVWLAFNWLFHSRTPSELYSDFNAIVGRAVEKALGDFKAKAADYAHMNGTEPGKLDFTGRVISFAELRQETLKAGGLDAQHRFDALASSLAGNDNPLNVTRSLVEFMAAEARITGPAVITGFSSLHYPHTHLDLSRDLDRSFAEALDRARGAIESRHATSFKRREYFTGISDMSFFGAAIDESDTAVVADNTPAALWVDRPPADTLTYPVVNIGPWGREFHQRLERLYMPYAFDVFPKFLVEIVREVLLKR